METILSVASKVQLDDHIRIDGLSEEMLDTMLDYLLTLRVSEGSKAKNPLCDKCSFNESCSYRRNLTQQ